MQSFPWPDDGREARESINRVRLRSVRESFDHICSHPFITLYVWLLIGIALSLPAGFWLFKYNIDNVSKEQSTETGLIVDFQRDLPPKDVVSAANELRRNPLVAEVDVTTAQQALDEFRVISGFDEELAALDSNPLPAFLTVTVRDGTTRDQILELAELLKQKHIVARVDVDMEWLVQLRRIQQIASRLTWILSALFGIGVVFVSVAAVRYAIDSRLEELRVIALLGASNRSMRRPFVYCGLLYGLGGGIVATCIVVFALMAIETPLQKLASSYGGSIESAAINYLLSGTLIVIGSVLGLIGSIHVTLVQMRKNRYLNRTS